MGKQAWEEEAGGGGAVREGSRRVSYWCWYAVAAIRELMRLLHVVRGGLVPGRDMDGVLRNSFGRNICSS